MINWKVRYGRLLERHPELFDPDRRILEVGSGSEGLARHLQRPVVGVDRVFVGPVSRHLAAVCGSVLALPFPAGAFDDVVCVDTLEHLREGDRLHAIRELVRIAGKRVIISGPAGTFAASGDTAYAEHITRAGGTVPLWLAEHLRHRIPGLGDLLEMLLSVGHPFTVHVNEGVIQHYAGLFADNYPFMARYLRIHDNKFPADTPLRAARGDVPYSYLFTIDTTSTRPMPAIGPKTDAAGAQRSGAALQPERIGLFAVGHRTDRMPAIPGIRRILAGGGTPESGTPPDILRDDAGDTIAERNPEYSEMTAIYWIWKNVSDLDAVGFCHYRRLFDFRKHLGSSRETPLRSLRDARQHESTSSIRPRSPGAWATERSSWPDRWRRELQTRSSTWVRTYPRLSCNGQPRPGAPPAPRTTGCRADVFASVLRQQHVHHVMGRLRRTVSILVRLPVRPGSAVGAESRGLPASDARFPLGTHLRHPH